MKVLALIENAEHVCYRYRFNALAWALVQEGLLLEALPIPKGLEADFRSVGRESGRDRHFAT